MELPTDETRSDWRIANRGRPARGVETQLTLRLLEEKGILAQKTEHWVATPHLGPRAGVRRDLFGFIDVLGLSATFWGVQVTSLGEMSTRARKITGEASEAAQAWLNAGGKIFIHGWGRYQWKKVDEEWSAAVKWLVKIREITWEDFRDESSCSEKP